MTSRLLLEDAPGLNDIEASPTRCPHPETAALMEARVLEAKKKRGFRRRLHSLPGERFARRMGITRVRPVGGRFGQSNALAARNQGI